MKNWTVKEAAKVIRENKDTEAIKEIVKHFPLFAVIVAAKDFDGLTDAMPEHMTVRKIENELNNGSAEDVDAEDGEDEADEADEAEDTAEDLENMSTKQLIALCGKRGIKVPKYGKNKQFYLDALNSAGDEDTDADEAEEAEEEDPVALYKKCKKAGLKVAPKKSAKYYKDQLAKVTQAEEDTDTDDEDDWDDEEDDEKSAKKTAKKAPAKNGAKKPAKKAESEEDDEEEDEDEDEWDI